MGPVPTSFYKLSVKDNILQAGASLCLPGVRQNLIPTRRNRQSLTLRRAGLAPLEDNRFAEKYSGQSRKQYPRSRPRRVDPPKRAPKVLPRPDKPETTPQDPATPGWSPLGKKSEIATMPGQAGSSSFRTNAAGLSSHDKAEDRP